MRGVPHTCQPLPLAQTLVSRDVESENYWAVTRTTMLLPLLLLMMRVPLRDPQPTDAGCFFPRRHHPPLPLHPWVFCQVLWKGPGWSG